MSNGKRKGEVCRLQFTVLVNDAGFENNETLWMEQMYLVPQCSFAIMHKKKTRCQMSPSNHFSQCPMVEFSNRFTMASSLAFISGHSEFIVAHLYWLLLLTTTIAFN